MSVFGTDICCREEHCVLSKNEIAKCGAIRRGRHVARRIIGLKSRKAQNVRAGVHERDVGGERVHDKHGRAGPERRAYRLQAAALLRRDRSRAQARLAISSAACAGAGVLAPLAAAYRHLAASPEIGVAHVGARARPHCER